MSTTKMRINPPKQVRKIAPGPKHVTRSKGFTLAQLRESAEMEAACSSHGMCTPSLIRLKTWSAQGMYQGAESLRQACTITVERMLLNKSAYPTRAGAGQGAMTQTLQGLPPGSEASIAASTSSLARERALRDAARHLREIEDAADDAIVLRRAVDDGPQDWDCDGSGEPFVEPEYGASPALPPQQGVALEQVESLIQRLIQPIADKNSEIERELRKLSLALNAAMAEIEHARRLSNGTESIPPELGRHITALDDARKHIMVRFDSEMQLLRSASPTTQAQDGVSVGRQSAHGHPGRAHTAQAADDETYLTLQKILIKVSRIGERLDGLEQR